MPNRPPKKVIWKPLPGSQCLALSAPVDHIMIDGTRGGGKTDVQIMRFRRHVGQGYGGFWRGVIVGRSYKALDDIVARSKRWFPKFGDGAKFKASQSSYKWVWPGGEELLLRVMEKPEDYEKFHGQEFCLEKDQLVSTPQGPVKIKDLSVGDFVDTPEGPKRVSKKFDVGVKPCVAVSKCMKDGTQRFLQLQSANHHLLTNARYFEKAQFGKSQKVLQFPGMTYQQEGVRKSLSCVGQDSSAFCVQRGCEGTYARAFGMKSQNVQQAQLCQNSQELDEVQLHSVVGCERHLPTSLRAFSKFSGQLQKHKAATKEVSSDLVQLPKLAELVFRPSHFCPHAVLSNGLVELQTIQGLEGHYSCGLCQCGGLAQKDKETALYAAQQPPCDAGQTRTSLTGGGVSESLNNRLCDLEFQHPYQKGKLIRTNLGAVEIEVVSEFAGYFSCFDIEVEDINCYFTTNGLVNKNCYLGWNELTQWATSECYDLLMSCNRSSFIPAEHSPDPDNPLPELPLMVVSTTNPSGPGHNWVKKRFVDIAPPGKVVRNTTRIFNPRTQEEEDVIKTQVRLFSSYKENRYLSPSYIADLNNITDPNKRKAWLEGDWNVTAGGALDDIWDNKIHIVPRFPIPDNWRTRRSHDWGSSHPFSTGFWAESNGEEIEVDGEKYCFPKGSLIRFAEDYGAEGRKDPNGQIDYYGHNHGLKLPSGEVAQRVKDLEESLLLLGWVSQSVDPGPADNQIFDVNDKESDSIAEAMAKKGVRWERSDKRKGSRKNGLQLMRDMLQNAVKGEGPGLYVMRNCKAFINTVPVLPRSEKDPDDVETTAIDHVYDETRYMVLDARPDYVTELSKLEFAT